MINLVSISSMKYVWLKHPRSFQLDTINCLLRMNFKGNQPSTMILVKGTGIDNSTVTMKVGVIMCGFTLILENTLSLRADHQSKYAKACQSSGPLYAFQLDLVNSSSEINLLSDLLLHLPKDTNA